ncbi:hypothetical protein AB5I41_29655 [Sphingomonas sp. MMS24-JH45]
MIEASFYGTQGGASLRNVGGSFYDFVAERHRGTARETLASPPDDGADAPRPIGRAGSQLRSGSIPEAAHFIAAAEALDRIYAAATRGA